MPTLGVAPESCTRKGRPRIHQAHLDFRQVWGGLYARQDAAGINPAPPENTQAAKNLPRDNAPPRG